MLIYLHKNRYIEFWIIKFFTQLTLQIVDLTLLFYFLNFIHLPIFYDNLEIIIPINLSFGFNKLQKMTIVKLVYFWWSF